MNTRDKITIDQLRELMTNPNTAKDDLKPYFRPSATGGPFTASLEIDPSRVETPQTPEGRARTAMLLNWANSWCRTDRQRRFEQRLAQGYSGPLIVSEGDSWFEYPILLDDVIDNLLDDYAILSLDAAGDTLQDMLRQAEYASALASTGASILLFSGGGNDLVAGGNLAEHLREYEEGVPAAQFLLPSFQHVLGDALACYDDVFRTAEKRFPNVTFIGHGYDCVVPNSGRWLGKPMESRGIKDKALQRQIVGVMIDQFNDGLKQLAKGYAKVVFLDNRGTIPVGEWYDELHPTDPGFRRISDKFRETIETVAATGAGAGRDAGSGSQPSKPSKTRGKKADRSAPPAPAVVSGRKAYSLHLGLNSVDPVHYQGWDGQLRSCEYDAKDMQAIAAQQGFDSEVLLTKAATSGALLKKLGDIANEFKEGDFLFLSCSSHGGTLPDYNGDEDDRQDETWCLYDRELIDDELYFLWRNFRPSVRILVVADCCHSGTSIRNISPQAVAVSLSPWLDAQVRMMPDDYAGRVYRENRRMYDDIQRSFPMTEFPLGREVAHPLRCSVRLLAACQDNQTAADLPTNGAFTQSLLRVWNDGRFEGDYLSFIGAIRRGMPPTQTPNHFVIGQPNAVFDRQKPFMI